jgi:Nuclease-related domain
VPGCRAAGPASITLGNVDAETGLEANGTALEANGTGPKPNGAGPEPNGAGPEPNGAGPGSPAGATAPGPGQAARSPVSRPVLGTLTDDPRLPLWIGRAVLASAAGIAVMIWQGWRLGVTAAALVAIADTIFRSKMAALQVTTAQRRTRRRLFLLRPTGYVALHRRAIPGSDSVIDHLVIGPAGVFALDSERWDRRLPVRLLSAGPLYHGPFSQEGRLEHAVRESAQAAGYLSRAFGREVRVHSAMAIYGPRIPWTVASVDGVDVFGGRRVRKYFRRQAKASRGARLDAGQIEGIRAAAARALPPAR